VRLKVTDTGHGIDEATLDRVFDPFFTTKDLGQGTGLGLSLVHSIVSDHGGAIEFSSTPGQGSRFTVYLPRSGETASASGIERVPIPSGRGETVLLVDDDEALVLLGEEMIAALGYEPIGFQDSQAALEAFQARPARFDLVVTDQLMPRMSGTELATRLREIRPDIPILLMSGFGGLELAHKARRAAVHALLKKPLQSRDLAQALARAFALCKTALKLSHIKRFLLGLRTSDGKQASWLRSGALLVATGCDRAVTSISTLGTPMTPAAVAVMRHAPRRDSRR
jgi:CheY-like chemotaxis protein